mmetsp:Transcript_116338/g.301582  ORF Transcript_116338/g.301582 Transcript_116338/m.301582 type:complete len:82 (+) Transcript_116338:417-662(+)
MPSRAGTDLEFESSVNVQCTALQTRSLLQHVLGLLGIRTCTLPVQSITCRSRVTPTLTWTSKRLTVVQKAGRDGLANCDDS